MLILFTIPIGTCWLYILYVMNVVAVGGGGVDSVCCLCIEWSVCVHRRRNGKLEGSTSDTGRSITTTELLSAFLRWCCDDCRLCRADWLTDGWVSVKESISLGKRSCYTDKSVIVNLFRTFFIISWGRSGGVGRRLRQLLWCRWVLLITT